MTKAAQKLKQKVLELSEEDREELAWSLFDSLPRADADSEEEFARELDRREAELVENPSIGIPAEVALAKLRKRLS